MEVHQTCALRQGSRHHRGNHGPPCRLAGRVRALATYAGAGPDLVYLPEVPFNMEEFWQNVNGIYRSKGKLHGGRL